MLHELLRTGIGAGLLLKEKVEGEIKKLEDEGKIKTSDAKSFLDSLKEKGEEEELQNKEKIKSILKEIIDELGIATKEDIEKLKKELL
jgi:polyhydroxyalkanoate synthesis regulator phasin